MTGPDPGPRIVVMGVSGSGKTTIGRPLAARLGLAYADADDFHPDANVAKMRARTDSPGCARSVSGSPPTRRAASSAARRCAAPTATCCATPRRTPSSCTSRGTPMW